MQQVSLARFTVEELYGLHHWLMVDYHRLSDMWYLHEAERVLAEIRSRILEQKVDT